MKAEVGEMTQTTRRGFVAILAGAPIARLPLAGRQQGPVPVFQASFNHRYFDGQLRAFPISDDCMSGNAFVGNAIVGIVHDAIEAAKLFEVDSSALDGYAIPGFPLRVDGDWHHYDLNFYRVGKALWCDYLIDGELVPTGSWPGPL